MYYHYIFTSSFFFDTRFLRSICTDLLQTLPYDVCSWAIENISCKFSYVPLKEIRGKPIVGDFSDTTSLFCNIILYYEQILKEYHITLVFTRYVYETC